MEIQLSGSLAPVDCLGQPGQANGPLVPASPETFAVSRSAECETPQAATPVPPQAVTQATGGAYQIQVFRNLQPLADIWQEFEKDAACTVFQSFRWVSAWCHTAAAEMGEEPVFVIAREPSGAVAFLLPLATRRVLGARVLQWLAQNQSAYNFGLFRKDIASQLSERDLRAVFAAIRRSGVAFNAVCFRGQPALWDGLVNPMAQLSCIPVASCYEVPLQRDFDAVCLRQLSSDKRQDLRRQWRRLSEHPVSVGIASRSSRDMIDTFVAHKTEQVIANGQPNLIGHPAIVKFFKALCDPAAPETRLEPGFIAVDGDTVSTINGMRFKDRFYHLNGAIAPTPLRRWSLAQLLIHDLMSRQCARGARAWDFGPGDGSHKALWRPNEIKMFDTLIALDRFGAAHIALQDAVRSARRAVSANRRIHAVAAAIRSHYLRLMIKER